MQYSAGNAHTACVSDVHGEGAIGCFYGVGPAITRAPMMSGLPRHSETGIRSDMQQPSPQCSQPGSPTMRGELYRGLTWSPTSAQSDVAQ